MQNFAAQAVIAIENTRLLNELRKSLLQQTATADVLKVISRSTFDLQTVLDTLVASAASLCVADKSAIWQRDGEFLRLWATDAVTPEAVQYATEHPLQVGRNSATGRAALEGKAVHILDVLADAEYGATSLREAAGYRTVLGVPLLRTGAVIGVFALTRQEVSPFSEKQIELVTTFADQAVIAIENARLFEAEQQRTRELTKSLEQQTATSEVLQVISSSPGDLEPVFATMLENAVRICDAKFGNIYRWDGNALHHVASHNVPPAFADARRRSPRRPSPEAPTGRMIANKTVIHVADVAAERAYIERDPDTVTSVEVGGVRSLLSVPMLKEDELVGAFALARDEVRPFSDKQIELVQNFAAQAVIAIENTRLLNELRESLQRQTATSEVLEVISHSAFDLQPVFDTMAENAVTLCEAERAFVFRFDGKLLRAVATYNVGPEARDFVDRNPIAPGRHSVSARAALERRTVQVADVQADPNYAYAMRDTEPIRTVLAVPMLKGDDLVGTITIYRLEAKPFTDKQVALVETFAAQAVIAIENTRLLHELRESLQQQTATADVLKVISRSTFDLQAVLDALLESAARLCAADRAALNMRDGDLYRTTANYGFSPEVKQYSAEHPLPPDRGSLTGRVALEGRAVHVPDVLADPEYHAAGYQAFGYRSVLGVPLLREGITIGVIALTRNEVNPFTEKQIELATMFADQAAIAIENVRLFEAEQQRTRELSSRWSSRRRREKFFRRSAARWRTPSRYSTQFYAICSGCSAHASRRFCYCRMVGFICRPFPASQVLND